MRKSQALRKMLKSSNLSFLMEAHDAVSAKIAEEAGFQGIWASSLCLSAALGVRDSNEVSWTQILEILEFMNDAISIPILLDGDTGHGNFNNFRRLVKKLEQHGIAGVCIEDKIFPKTNSLISGATQDLADIDEFCGKIKAGKDIQRDKDFSIVARVESFIAGCGLKEALKRAEAYRQAGADAILIHSKKNDPGEIFSFAREWANRAPLVIVPTTYYGTSSGLFRKHKISVVIWGNHLLRGSITAMKQVADTIKKEESVATVEDQIAPIAEVFRLQGVSELMEAEDRYLNIGYKQKPNALILAASRGQELKDLTLTRPKAMISISGKPILQHLVEDIKNQGVKDITVVGGYKPETIKIPDIRIVKNPGYAKSRDLSSLGFVLNRITANTLIAYGDLLTRKYVIRDILESEAPLTIVVDSNISYKLKHKIRGDYVRCSRHDDRGIFNPDVKLVEVFDSTDLDKTKNIHGQWIGLIKISSQGKQWLKESYQLLKKRKDFNNLSVTDLLASIVRKGYPVSVIYISGHWLDVNNLPDIERATEFTKGII